MWNRQLLLGQPNIWNIQNIVLLIFYLYSTIPAPYNCPFKHEFCSSASFLSDVRSFRALFGCFGAERFAALIRRWSTSIKKCIILNWSSVEVWSWHVTILENRYCIRCTDKIPTLFIKIGHLLWKNWTLFFIESIVDRIVLLAFGTNLDLIMLPIPRLRFQKYDFIRKIEQ